MNLFIKKYLQNKNLLLYKEDENIYLLRYFLINSVCAKEYIFKFNYFINNLN